MAALHPGGHPAPATHGIGDAGPRAELRRLRYPPRAGPWPRARWWLASSGAGRLQIVAQRRLMLKTGKVLARRLGAAALVTGDSLGQVSSQTLANLTALDDAVSLPILRPLIGHDKIEIIDEARRIRTLPCPSCPIRTAARC